MEHTLRNWKPRNHQASLPRINLLGEVSGKCHHKNIRCHPRTPQCRHRCRWRLSFSDGKGVSGFSASWRPTSHHMPCKTPHGKPDADCLWRTAIDSGRLVVISPFAENVHRTITAQAQNRNEFVAALSHGILVPHASPQGKTEAIAQAMVQFEGFLFTFDDDDNANLISRGAHAYDVNSVRNRLCCGDH